MKALADNWAERVDVRERFLGEARMLRRADSDHVVRVYDIGETADRIPYFVMTYADQGTVADLIQQGRALDVAEVVDLITGAADGLSVLHAHGIVHRDIKPQNLLLRTDSQRGRRLLIADLGVAKAMLHASGITQVVGTPAYMAPEQVHMASPLDERADVHALGAVAYHLLTGQPARTGDMMSLLQAQLPPAPSVYRAELAPLDDVILGALHPQPDQRWDTAAAFAAALRNPGPRPAAGALRNFEAPRNFEARRDLKALRAGEQRSLDDGRRVPASTDAGTSSIGSSDDGRATAATPAVRSGAAIHWSVWLLAAVALVAGFFLGFRVLG